MIIELGHFALILALGFAMFQGTIPFLGIRQNIPHWMTVAHSAARGQFLFMMLAYAALTYAFISHDFSVAYVANNSNSQLPLLYLISGVWGSHEGSLLLWVVILSTWGLAVSLFSHRLTEVLSTQILAILGLVNLGFLLFILLTSNPFVRVFPAPLEGRDLNPMLQDPGLAFHPPLLYMGYVGFSVVFAFAIAALLQGRLDGAWARWARPWTTLAWVFLTLGIVLGSYWAYYELGWGGWWFWDPVENASLMPWLLGTALIHSLAVTEKRGGFKEWTLLLAIFTFSLSLLGTFLVRSGVLTSVHAFASDPTRGVFILILLAIVIGSSLTLYAIRAPQLLKADLALHWSGRESALLANNVLLTVIMATVLLGTLYPLIVDALKLGKLSVGAPYFNTVFVPLAAPLGLLVGLASWLSWRKSTLNYPLLTGLWVISTVAAFFLAGQAYHTFSWQVTLGMTLAIWVALGVSWDLIRRFWIALPQRIPRLGLGYYGMFFAHAGIAVFIVGATLASSYTVEKTVRFGVGRSLEIADYHLTWLSSKESQGKNYRAVVAEIEVSSQGKKLTVLRPEKRQYLTGMPMTEVGIYRRIMGDLYVALGEPVEKQGDWAVRVHYKPFIRWIWVGGLLMALGGMLAMSDRRYRQGSPSK